MDDRYFTVSEKEPETVTVDKQSSTPSPEPVVPDYAYGRNQEPLDGAIAVRGVGGAIMYATATTRSSTGDLTVTGCPFSPKYVTVSAFVGFSGCTSSSVGFSSGGAGSMAGASDGSTDNSNSYLVILRDNGGTVTHRATLSSFTADGCVINFSTASGTASLLITLHG